MVEKQLEDPGSTVKLLNWCLQDLSPWCNSLIVQLTKVHNSTMRPWPAEHFLMVHNENGKKEAQFQGKLLCWTGVQQAVNARKLRDLTLINSACLLSGDNEDWLLLEVLALLGHHWSSDQGPRAGLKWDFWACEGWWWWWRWGALT